MRILVVTPKLPWPATGADEQDRLSGIILLKELGHEVRVIAKSVAYQKPEAVAEMSAALDVPVETVPYTKGGFSWQRITNPYWWDGAAFEYTEPAVVAVVERALREWKPDLVWLDYSSLWPLGSMLRASGIAHVIRSANRESHHLLSDEGWSLGNLARALGKELGERTVARTSVAAITPHEADFYTLVGGQKVFTLPLRALPAILEMPAVAVKDRAPLHVLFAGSTYSVGHNRRAVELVIREIAPRIEKESPGTFIFHITGAKLPETLARDLPRNVIYEGYVPNFADFLERIDIAFAPSLGGAGMQQKIFEPIARGIPTITSPRGLAGYPLIAGVAVLTARTAPEFVTALRALADREVREKVARAGRASAEALFNREMMLTTLRAIIESA